MTGHPPISDGVNREIMLDPELVAMATRGAGVFYALPRIMQLAAPILWREWTRGRAVVELPEPDVSAYPRYGASAEADQYWEIQPDDDEYGSLLQIQYPPYRLPLDEARAFFAAGLAACANAERLIAEFLARPKPSTADTTGGES